MTGCSIYRRDQLYWDAYKVWTAVRGASDPYQSMSRCHICQDTLDLIKHWKGISAEIKLAKDHYIWASWLCEDHFHWLKIEGFSLYSDKIVAVEDEKCLFCLYSAHVLEARPRLPSSQAICFDHGRVFDQHFAQHCPACNSPEMLRNQTLRAIPELIRAKYRKKRKARPRLRAVIKDGWLQVIK